MRQLKRIPFHFEYVPKKKKYLIVNFIGNSLYLNASELKKMVKTPISSLPKGLLHRVDGVLLGDEVVIEQMSRQYRNLKCFLNTGPTLHIVVVTLECQLACVYCHASASCHNTHLVMNRDTAEKVVQFILSTKTPTLTIEFQGGEPLLSWDIVKYIIERAEEINKTKNKSINFSLVTNCEVLSYEKLEFLKQHKVGLCTSFDGPKRLHDKNRPYVKHSNYDVVSKWIRYIKKAYDNYDIAALTTITKDSLSYPKEVIDTYLDHGLSSVFLRPLNPFGRAEKRSELHYSCEEFMDFYRKALDYILEINKRGICFQENFLHFFLIKKFFVRDNGFVDMCSPCGAGIRNLAYNFNGKIYTCDEGRMLSVSGDETFCLGTVDDTYHDIVKSEPVCRMIQASCTEGKPYCSQCVYQPFCGVCPVYNHKVQGEIHGSMARNEKCRLNKMMFAYYFELLEDEGVVKILQSWCEGNRVDREDNSYCNKIEQADKMSK